jgi:3-oxoacyl-[acyl-carrier protein] reductase
VTAVRDLEDRVAVITGAGGEIGMAIATRLAAMGAAVVVNHRDGSDAEAAQRTAAAARAAGARSAVVEADISDPAAVRRLFDTAVAEFGHLDILVNNAGVGVFGLVTELTDTDFERAVAANVRGVFLSCREAASRLAAGGRVITLSSSSTAVTLPGYGLYSATKAAAEQLSSALARELGARAITVNVVSPGPIDTAAFRRGKTKAVIEQLRRMSPMDRLGTPDDVAGVIGLLCQPAAGWITGQNIRVNGGQA